MCHPCPPAQRGGDLWLEVNPVDSSSSSRIFFFFFCQSETSVLTMTVYSWLSYQWSMASVSTVVPPVSIYLQLSLFNPCSIFSRHMVDFWAVEEKSKCWGGKKSFEIHLVQLFFAFEHLEMLNLYLAWDGYCFKVNQNAVVWKPEQVSVILSL